MRKYLLSAAVAALALALVVPAHAQEVKAKKGMAKTHEFTGTIEKIDGNSVTLKKGDESKTVVCDDKTKISTADKMDSATVTDLKVGDKVLAKYVEEGDKNIAKSITPPPAKPAGKKGKKKE